MKNTVITTFLLCVSIISSAFTFSFCPTLEGGPTKEMEDLKKPMLSIDWHVIDKRKELEGTKMSLFMNGKHLKDLTSTIDGWFKIELFLTGVYKVVISQEGYLNKEIILGFNKAVALQDELNTAVEVDLMSLKEFDKLRLKEGVARTEILIYNEKSQVFEPGFSNGMFLKERFHRLQRKVKNVNRIPTSKFSS
jgi:hypothetical protein